MVPLGDFVGVGIRAKQLVSEVHATHVLVVVLSNKGLDNGTVALLSSFASLSPVNTVVCVY